MVKEIHKAHLHTRFQQPALGGLRQLAIDEISLGKGRWKTIVLDLDSGAIVFAAEGKKGSVLKPFFRRLKWSQANIEAVAVDFGKAYIAAVRRDLPNAVLVFDRFHLVKLFNEKLTQLRRDLYREATGPLKGHVRGVLKGTRWLLLKCPDALDDSRDERERLAKALRLNEPLAKAYYLKEDLRQFWEQDSKAQAWNDYPISTGPLEGTSKKIKTLNRTHYNFRDDESFTRRLYNLRNAQSARVG